MIVSSVRGKSGPGQMVVGQQNARLRLPFLVSSQRQMNTPIRLTVRNRPVAVTSRCTPAATNASTASNSNDSPNSSSSGSRVVSR